LQDGQQLNFYNGVPNNAITTTSIVFAPGEGWSKAAIFQQTKTLQTMVDAGYHVIAFDWPANCAQKPTCLAEILQELRVNKPIFVCLPVGCAQGFDLMKNDNSFFAGFVTVGAYVHHGFTTVDYDFPVYQAIQTPTLAIIGEKDTNANLRASFVGKMPKGQIAIVQGAYGNPYADGNEPTFWKLLKDFASQHTL